MVLYLLKVSLFGNTVVTYRGNSFSYFTSFDTCDMFYSFTNFASVLIEEENLHIPNGGLTSSIARNFT